MWLSTGQTQLQCWSLWLHLMISVRLRSLRVALSFSSTPGHFVTWKKERKRGAEKGWNIILYFLRNHAFGTLSCVSVRLWKQVAFWSTSQAAKFKQSRTKSVSTSFFCDLLRLSMPSSKGSPILSWQIQSWLSLKLRIIFRCSDRATCAFRWLSSDLMSSPNNGGVSRSERRRRCQRWWHSSPCTLTSSRRREFLQ